MRASVSASRWASSLLGVSYAPLWGFLAAVLRFIPYVGVWLAALLLIVFALAAFPTWHQPLYVAGLFVLLEALCSFALEPLLYGQSAGVSQVALICSVAFWAWLWGPIGLLLATPTHGVPGGPRQARPGHGVHRHPDGRRAVDRAAHRLLPALARGGQRRGDAHRRGVREGPPDRGGLRRPSSCPPSAARGAIGGTSSSPKSAERYVWRATREIVLDLHAHDRPSGPPPMPRRAPGRRRSRPPGRSYARQSGARRGRRAGPDHAGAPHGPRVLDDRADLARSSWPPRSSRSWSASARPWSAWARSPRAASPPARAT